MLVAARANFEEGDIYLGFKAETDVCYQVLELLDVSETTCDLGNLQLSPVTNGYISGNKTRKDARTQALESSTPLVNTLANWYP